jgi:hypothetical protein
VRWLGVFLALAFALPAHAWTHGGGGSGPVTQSVSFGAKTLAGYGGVVPPGLSGALTINSETNGSTNPSTDFAVNKDLDGTNGQIVPCTQGSLTCTAYGTAAPSYNGPYTLNVSDSHGHTVNLTINMVANQATVKSQWGFATHGDTPSTSGFQLGKVMSSASSAVIALGDTVIMRGDCGCDAGITPELNPHPILANNYDLEPPASYAASTGGTYASGLRIQITSEIPNTGNDANGNPIDGGNASFGELRFHGGNISPNPIPVDIRYVRNYINWAFVPTLSTSAPMSNGIWTTTSVTGWGYGIDHDRFEVGPNVPAGELYLFRVEAVSCAACVATNNHFVGAWFGGISFDQHSVGQASVGDAENNICENVDQNCLTAVLNSVNPIIKSNFMFNGAGTNWNPLAGEYFIIGSNVYNWVSGAPAKQGDISLSPSWELSMMRAACVVNGGGSIPWTSTSGTGPGTYSCLSGTDYWASETPDPNVSVIGWKYNGGVYYLNFQALSVGTAGNSIGLHAGSLTFDTCSDAGAQGIIASCLLVKGVAATNGTWWNTSATVNTLATSMSGGTVSTAALGWFTASEAHSDFFIHDGISVTGTYAAGTREFNIGFRGLQIANQGGQQFLFTGGSHGCCSANMVENNNLSYMGDSNAYYLGNDNNPDVETNTSLADITDDLYNPADPDFPTFSLTGLANAWKVIPFAANTIYAAACTGTGGGTFLDNAVNFPAATETGSGSGQQCGSPTSTPQPNAGVAGGFPTTPNNVTQAGAITAYLYSYPHVQNNFAQSLTGVPGCPAGAGICNRAAAIWWYTPAITSASNFVGTISGSGSYTLTVTSGPVPAQWTPINGPLAGNCIPPGDLVFSVAGSVLTLTYPSTCGSAGVTYGTGVENPDGTYNGALTPADSNGQPCWNVAGTVFNAAQTCAAQGLTVAQ